MAATPHEILAYMRQREPQMVELLGRLVETESPSLDREATGRLVDLLEAELRQLGCTTERRPQERYADHLLARYWPGGGSAAASRPDGQLLVLCHIDTVWPVGETAWRPFRVEEGRAYGPGSMDMKGGVVQALYALRALGELGIAPSRPVVLLFNTDEEVGSPTSRPLIEEQARLSRAVFVLEPAEGVSIKTFRKGVGQFRVRVEGRAAHAGADHQRGVNAIEELAHQIIRIQGLTDYATGTTLNVGVVTGGSRSNVVPASAEASVDCRVCSMTEAHRILETMRALRPVNPAAKLVVEGGVNRPPMERSPAIAAIFERARALGAELGLDITEAGTGGASDGNFTAALGLPTLDGLGAVGEGGHAVDEYLITRYMPERAALLVRLLATV